MPDPITDPPTPEETAETERLAGELLRGCREPVPEAAARTLQDFLDLCRLFRGQRDESRSQADRLRAAILKHRHQRGDDRCWLDDDELYAALGDAYVCYRELPAECEFLESCRRYWRQRQTPDERDTPRPEYEMTIGQMQEEIPALRAKVSDLSLALAREAGRREKAERERDAAIAVAFYGARNLFGLTDPEIIERLARSLRSWTDPSGTDERRRLSAAVRKAAGLDAEKGGGA